MGKEQPDASASSLGTSQRIHERPRGVSRVLIICPDTTGPLMAGTAIRSVEIAATLAREHRVTLAVPKDSAPVDADVELVRVPLEATLPALVANADCVVISGRTELMTAIRKPLIVDLYDPFILSDLEFYGARFGDAGGRPLLALRWLQHHLENGDFFLCASESQRRFWLGMLASAGRLNHANYAEDRSFEKLLAVVLRHRGPQPARAGVRASSGDRPRRQVVLWAGGLELSTRSLLEALHRLHATRPNIKGVFLGVRHPNPDIGVMEQAERTLARARELDLVDRVAFFVDWVPYAERQNVLLEADVAVSLHQTGIEAQFAFRTRVLDYLWAGLPMVLSRGDDLAERIEREGLGITVPEGDVDAVARAITALVDGPAPADRAVRFAALRDEFAWTRVVEPIALPPRSPFRARQDDRRLGRRRDAARADHHKEDALIAEEFSPRRASLAAAQPLLCRRASLRRGLRRPLPRRRAPVDLPRRPAV
jgi:glycosyltransferase involved in cell wall biosynthesis